jgi:molybdate/tungstate transport system substrate-binding protein
MASKKMISLSAAIAVVAVVAVYAVSGISNSNPALITYSADAYVQESNALLNAFHNSSGVHISPAVGGGSFAVARQIGHGAPSDIFISVSSGAYARSYLQSRYSGWAVAFAADQLVIAYSSATLQNSSARAVIADFRTAASTNSSSSYFNAFQNFTSGSTKIGIANPADDPAGLRGWFALEIAGYLYAGGNRSYFTGNVNQNNAYVPSTSAATLVAPLVAGDIQFLFIYKSAAISDGLHFLSLPPEINQGSSNLTSFYSGFTYALSTGNVSCSPIYLFITVLANNTNEKASMEFVQFVVSHTSLLGTFGMTPLSPAIVFSSVPLPSSVENLVKEGALSNEGAL